MLPTPGTPAPPAPRPPTVRVPGRGHPRAAAVQSPAAAR
jgi:hypothetical protein